MHLFFFEQLRHIEADNVVVFSNYPEIQVINTI